MYVHSRARPLRVGLIQVRRYRGVRSCVEWQRSERFSIDPSNTRMCMRKTKTKGNTQPLYNSSTICNINDIANSTTTKSRKLLLPPRCQQPGPRSYAPCMHHSRAATIDTMRKCIGVHGQNNSCCRWRKKQEPAGTKQKTLIDAGAARGMRSRPNKPTTPEHQHATGVPTYTYIHHAVRPPPTITRKGLSHTHTLSCAMYLDLCLKHAQGGCCFSVWPSIAVGEIDR